MELKRSTSNGVEVVETYWDAEGNEYEVPVYRIPTGRSANDVAAALGGRCVKPSETREAASRRSIFAAVYLEGRYCPVVK